MMSYFDGRPRPAGTVLPVRRRCHLISCRDKSFTKNGIKLDKSCHRCSISGSRI
jgi:hypothetical protein